MAAWELVTYKKFPKPESNHFPLLRTLASFEVDSVSRTFGYLAPPALKCVMARYYLRPQNGNIVLGRHGDSPLWE